MKKTLLIIAGALIVLGTAVAGALYWAFPVRVSIFAGLTRNYILSWSAPTGTANTQVNRALQAASTLALLPVAGAVPSASGADWPTYNRTLDSQPYSPLSQINTNNVEKLKVLFVVLSLDGSSGSK